MSKKAMTLREPWDRARDAWVALEAAGGPQDYEIRFFTAVEAFSALGMNVTPGSISLVRETCAALDAEAAKSDAAGYERGRREALEEVRGWLDADVEHTEAERGADAASHAQDVIDAFNELWPTEPSDG